jgi:hypothetical protein
MKRALFFAWYIICFAVRGQSIEIELKNFPVQIEKRDFYIQQVWDGRSDTSKLGWSALNKETEGRVYTLKGGLEASLGHYFQQNLPRDSGQIPLILNVTSLIVSERVNVMREGKAILVVQFFKEQEGMYGKVYETSFQTESQSEFGKDIYTTHERRIRFLLATCLKNLAQSKWKEIKPDYISFQEIRVESHEKDTLSRSISDSAKVFRSKKEIEQASLSKTEISYSKDFVPTYRLDDKKYRTLWPFKWHFQSLADKELNALYSDYKAKYKLSFFTFGIGAALLGLSFVEGDSDSGLPNLSLAVPGIAFAGCSFPIYFKSKKIARATVDKYNAVIRSK